MISELFIFYFFCIDPGKLKQFSEKYERERERGGRTRKDKQIT